MSCKPRVETGGAPPPVLQSSLWEVVGTKRSQRAHVGDSNNGQGQESHMYIGTEGQKGARVAKRRGGTQPPDFESTEVTVVWRGTVSVLE